MLSIKNINICALSKRDYSYGSLLSLLLFVCRWDEMYFNVTKPGASNSVVILLWIKTLNINSILNLDAEQYVILSMAFYSAGMTDFFACFFNRTWWACHTLEASCFILTLASRKPRPSTSYHHYGPAWILEAVQASLARIISPLWWHLRLFLLLGIAASNVSHQSY